MAWYKAGGGSKPKQSKTVTPSTGVQEITADSGKELEKVTVQAMPSGALKTPTVNASGLVTSGVQTSGYLGTSAESTLQLSTQGARTFTPTITNTTLVSSGKYTTGAIICKGDANLKAENIKSGKSIFGVNGSAPVTKIDGVVMDENLNLKTTELQYVKVGEPRSSVISGSGRYFTMNGIIYAIVNSRIYKLNDDYSFTQVAQLDHQLNNNKQVVVHNGHMHTVNGYNYVYGHEKFDGTNLIKCATPTGLSWSEAISDPIFEYNGELYLMGNVNSKKQMWKYDENADSWTLISTVPPFSPSQQTYSFELDDGIHFIQWYTSSAYHYVWDGTTFTSLSLTGLPNNIMWGDARSENGMGYMVMNYCTSYYEPLKKWKWNGASWELIYTTPSTNNTGQTNIISYLYEKNGTVFSIFRDDVYMNNPSLYERT